MTGLDTARRLLRELGGDNIDLFTLPEAVVERAATTGRPLPEVARDVLSAWYVEHAQAGDEAAAHRLLELWFPEVLRWCRWNAPRGVDADDAAHDILLRAADRLDRLDRPHGVRPWLWAITWRVLSEARRRPWLTRWVWGRTPEHVSPAPSVESHLQDLEENDAVRRVLQTLTLEERTLLWHAYVEGLSRPAIAELTGMPLGRVNRTLTQAREGFRAEAARQDLRPLANLPASRPEARDE